MIPVKVLSGQDPVVGAEYHVPVPRKKDWLSSCRNGSHDGHGCSGGSVASVWGVLMSLSMSISVTVEV